MTLNTQNDSALAEQQTSHTRVSDEQQPASDKRRFVEPEVSAPVNVLEATTFFQASTSGGTN